MRLWWGESGLVEEWTLVRLAWDAGANTILTEAAGFDYAHIAAAMDYRIRQTWADKDDDLLVAFVAARPDLEEIAVRTTREMLGSNLLS